MTLATPGHHNDSMSEPRHPRLARPSDFESSDDDYTTTMDSFFSGQKPLFSLSEKIWSPPTDVYEAGSTIYVKIEIAGVREEDLDIAIDGNLLRVRGKRREDLPSRAKATFHLMELRYGQFERVFGLPSSLDLGSVSATYRDGFLLIEIPKLRSEPREIQITVD